MSPNRETRVIRANGIIAFWTAKACDRQELVDSLGDMGVHVPQPRTPRSALQKAMEQHARRSLLDTDAIVLPLVQPGTNGLECRIIRRGTTVNQASHWFSAKVDSDLVSLTAGFTRIKALRALYRNYRAELTAKAVGQCLVNLAQQCSAVSIREAGGIYWLPEGKCQQWQELSEKVAHVSRSVVIHGVLDDGPTAIKALRERLLANIESDCSVLMNEICDGQSHTDEYYQARRNKIQALHDKVLAAEESIGESLEACQESVERTQAALFQSAMASHECHA